MMDTSELGKTAATLMELLSEEEPEDSKLGVVMILAEITGTDERGDWTSIRWRCSDPRGWVQRGLLAEALAGQEAVVRDPDDDEDAA